MAITLTNPFTFSQGSTTVFEDTVTSITEAWIDYVNEVAYLLLQNGSMSDGEFVLDQVLSQNNMITIDLTTGNWEDQFDHSGTIDPTTFTTFLTQIINTRNGGEQLALTGGIAVGTLSPWTTETGL